MRLKSINFLTACLLLLGSCSYFPENFDPDLYPEITETHKYIRIGNQGDKAFVFYPGGLVDPHAYVEMLSLLVDDDLSVFIPKVPYNLAILNIGHAEEIRDVFPEIEEWGIGGHSLGGSVACFVVNDYPAAYDYLILLASYPSENLDLKVFKGPVLSLFGSSDGVADLEKLKNSKDQFNNPKDIDSIDNLDPISETSYFIEIEGGNHGNFGNYGLQNGDNVSTISREDQQSITINYISKIVNK